MSQKNTKKCHRCKPGTKKIASINSKWKLPHLFMEISPKYAMPECSPNLQNYHHKKANPNPAFYFDTQQLYFVFGRVLFQ